MEAKTQYARSGDVHIAYQVVGNGPFDLVLVSGWVSHVELAWEEPTQASFLNRLASFSRLITFDKRGTGLSDRVADDKLPSLEVRMDDLRAVMDAAGSERAVIYGVSEGGNLAMLFAATYPDRTSALIINGSFSKRIWSPDYPWAPTVEKRAKEYENIEQEWGNLMDVSHYVPSMVGNEAFIRSLATYFRRSASPGAALTLMKMNTQIDTRAILPTIQVPTLVIHRVDDEDVKVEEGRYIASRIPGARFVELPGADHLPWVGDQESVLAEIQEFLTGVRPLPESDRTLATVMLTDIVGSTEHAVRLGDRGWKSLLEQHNQAVRKELQLYRGREIDTAGDGVFATFDGPARAVRCACAVREAVSALGIQIRAGLHTGEVEQTDREVRGIAVHIGARVAALAGAGEVLVSSTVKDLVSGSGLRFEDRGMHALKGVPDEWRLFAVV